MQWLSNGSVLHLVQTYGLWVVFAGVMLESIGLPVPGETVLITAALFVGATHQFTIVEVIGVAAAAGAVGDNIGFLIGRSIGLTLLEQYGRYVRLTEERLILGEYLFLRHGGKIVFFGRFVALLRTFAALLAGANRMRWRQFVIMNALGAICWASIIGGGAYLLGDRIRTLSGPIGLALLVGAVLSVGIGALFIRRHEAALQQRARAALGMPVAGRPIVPGPHTRND